MADEGSLGADGAPDAGSARVQMADRAARGALGADGAQDSDKERRKKNDFQPFFQRPRSSSR